MARAVPFPRAPEGLTAEWLSEVLRPALGRPDLVIGRVTSSRIGQSESFTGGSLWRLWLDLGGSEEDGHLRLVAKFAPFAPDLRLAMARANRNEVAVYQGAGAPGFGLPVPRCLFAAAAPEDGASLLLLQDLGGHRAVRLVDGCRRAEAEAVVRALAQIHATAPVPGRPGGAGLAADPRPGLLPDPGLDPARLWPDYPAALGRILPDVALPPWFLALGEALAARAAGPAAVPPPDGGCLLHGDPHVENVLLDPAAGPPGQAGTACLLDWQFSRTGPGADDLCYFLTSSLPVDLRRSAERDLLALYLRQRQDLGRPSGSAADLWAGYRAGVAGKLALSIAATVLWPCDTAEKRAYRRADLGRLLAFCADHAITPRDLA